MRSWSIFYKAGSRFCLRCLTSFALWALWTFLGVMLLAQLWIASVHELSIPSPLLRIIERHLSRDGISYRFGRIVLDPSGQLVVRDFSAILDSFDEPFLKADLLHTKIDPWGLLAGDPDAHQIEISGAQLLLPAPLSPSGRSEAFVKELDAVVNHQGRLLEIRNLNAQIGDIVIAAHGAILMDAWKRSHAETQTPGLEADRITAAMREFAQIYPRLDIIQGTRVSLELSPSESRGAIVEATLTADILRLESPIACEVGPILVQGRFPLSGESPTMTRINVFARSVKTSDISLEGLQAVVRGVLSMSARSFDPKEADLSVASLTTRGVTLEAPSLHVEAGPLPKLKLNLTAELAGVPVGATGLVDTADKSGTLHIATNPTDALLKEIGTHIGVDLGQRLSFPGYFHLEADARFGAGARLMDATGWLEADKFSIMGVPMDHIQSGLQWNGHQFQSIDTVLRTGVNIARGSYWMDADTLDYRFLLKGGLRPLDISPWFTEWWPALWHNFIFDSALPDADIDILGRWLSPDLSKVFLGVDVHHPVISSVTFDKANTQLYILPNFIHSLWLKARRPEGEATGWFVRRYNPVVDDWKSIDFDIESTVEPHDVARIFAPTGPEIVEPFYFANAPSIHARGRLDGPGAPGGLNHIVDLEISSRGSFQFMGFPLEDLNCSVHWDDVAMDISKASAHFAQGQVNGKIYILEKGDRKLSFDGSLKDAKLADAVFLTDTYFAKRNGEALPKAPSTDKALESRLDVTLKAEGLYGDPLSFHGPGEAQISGSELGQVHMLGLLSQLLRFTTLRFTTATSPFVLDGKQIVFPALRIKGKNSAIEGKGRYSLENRTLDFNAKVWPFEESQNILQGAIGLVLSPISNALEVKLEGTLSNPSWSFANNPFRSRTNPVEPTATPDTTKAAPTSPPSATPVPVPATEEKPESATGVSPKTQSKD